MQPFSKQQLSKYFSAATDTNATTEEWYFLCGPCRDVINRTFGSSKSVVGWVVSSSVE
jgi:hypothetical protein